MSISHDHITDLLFAAEIELRLIRASGNHRDVSELIERLEKAVEELAAQAPVPA